ncbi:MAG: hypothetical protein HY983_03500 [Candidatus Magasanikbacteria bacterium]|nr:hypothetical protein [Candidatus Magasanikbacteria bacterium]
MATSAPTILVKKADGTFVRMSLDELKASKQPGKQPAPAPKAPALVVAPKPVAQQRLQVPQPMPKPAPAKPVLPKKTDADFSAPLTDELAPAVNAGPKLSANRVEQVDAIMKKLSFTVPAHSINRLRTIIQLCLKDVRSSDQTKDALLRTELDGGMALSAKQADEVLEKCQTRPPAAGGTGTIQPLKPRLAAKTAPAPKNLPEIRPESLPTTTTPNNVFKHEPFKLSSAPAPKPVMHDVVGKPVSLTPVDEVRYFSLTDFRRLAADPAEAARRLRQKFSNLKDESVVLYLQGLTAWRNCPLYLEYLNTILGTLASGQKLPSPRDRKMMQFNELSAIVAMEQTLEYL